MSDGSLLAAALEATRAVHLAQEAEHYGEAADAGHDPPSIAARHEQTACDALRRAAKRLEGEAFRLQRSAIEHRQTPDGAAA